MITIISKIELEGTDNLKYSDVGFTTDVSVINEINEGFDVTLGAFLGENRTKLEIGEVSISTFFNGVAYVNEARTEVTDVSGLNLTEITDINQL
jgi:hypothetical protein|tara:strand:+ start:345 stop:626 length:282 start_codon:yes stop_codon:yes gene_type:complete